MSSTIINSVTIFNGNVILFQRSSNRNSNVNNNSSHIASDWRSAIYQHFYDAECSTEDGELCLKTEPKYASEPSLALANSSEGIYSPDPDHDNEVSKSSEVSDCRSIHL